jgi:hypothetical protein
LWLNRIRKQFSACDKLRLTYFPRASWQKQVSRPKGLTVADVRERPPTDPTLACPIDNRLFRDAVKTPCCETTYCEECVQTHLLERDFICPKCGKKIASLDKLVMDKPMRTIVADHIDKVIEQSRKEGEEGVTAMNGTAPTGEQVGCCLRSYVAFVTNKACEGTPGGRFRYGRLLFR